MTLPYRDWTVFYQQTLKGADPNNPNFTNITDWTTDHIDGILVGDGGDTPWNRWSGVFIPSASTYALLTSLDAVIDAFIEAEISPVGNTGPATKVDIQTRTMDDPTDPNTWDPDLASGRFYDGINLWPAGPPHTGATTYSDVTEITFANLPVTIGNWIWSYKSGVGFPANAAQDDFFRTGFIIRAASYDVSPYGVGKLVQVSANIKRLRVRYFNAVVNSISPSFTPLAGGGTLVLTGLGFDMADAELEEHMGPLTPPPADWNADVIRIDLEGNEGQGDYQFDPGVGAQKFVINSDTQITMTLPALAEGTYTIHLRKTGWPAHSYAGDFSVNDDGLVTPGIRMAFTASDAYAPPEETQPLILTDWVWKKKNGDTALRSYAPIDAPSPDVFYDGRIINISSLKREVDDNTGLFSISDVTIDLANHDKEMSKLLADYFLKNQIVDIYQHFGSQPYADKTLIHKCIVDDYSLNGTTFSVLLKDITRKYFGVRVPRYRCTEAEYTNIHDSAKGVAMPEVLGLCAVTGDTPGAAEAVYVDTVNFIYLAARGSLNSVDTVYSDNLEQTDGVDYDIVYADGGRTYIDFVRDQGDNKITFNCKGYMYNVLYDWNSGNGYIQSPIYITAFLLAFIAEIPWELIDLTSFDTLATEFIAEGWDETGHLILQNEADLDEVLKDLLFTCGNYGFVAIDGRFKVVRKDIDDYIDTTLRIYDQIDVMTSAKRSYNLNAAVNYIQSIYNFYPAPNQSFGSFEDKRESSIEDYEAEIMTASPVQFPWTNSLTLVQDRITSMLLKRGYGDHRISFSLSIKWFKQLDLLTNFQYQDPFGLSSTGAGEVGRYYYIISLNYNWMSATIDVEAVDLQWLLRQYFILGDYTELAATWDLETEANKIYGFLCDYDTKEFADGEPGKIL